MTVICVGGRRYDPNNLSARDLNEILRAVTTPQHRHELTLGEIMIQFRLPVPEAEELLAKIHAL